MAFNGSGTFVRLYNWQADAAVPATNFIRADKMDAETDGIATGLSNCITRDGQSVPFANLPMGGFIFTGLGPGVNAGDSATIDDPNFIGTPTAPTAAAGTSTTQIATTAFAMTMTDPGFLGTPTAPTASPGTSTTQIATTGFVATSFAPIASPTFTGDPKAPTPAFGDRDTSIPTTLWVGNEFATIASPALTGVPTAPTAALGTNTDQIATTAFATQLAFATALPVQTAAEPWSVITTTGGSSPSAFWGAGTPQFLIMAQGVV